MALQKKLDSSELALLEIIEDPVWLNEFLRSTNNADMNKNNWPADEFKHRPYQKEILTDQNKHIVVTGGRAIGKCQPPNAKIFTADGFKTISELLHLKNKSFITYAYSVEGKWEQRRAVITKDKWTRVHKYYTNSGHVVECTHNHPILTPDGFVVAGDLKIGSLIGVVNMLPTEHCTNNTFSWFELRLMGYDALNTIKLRGYLGVKPRYKQIAEELEFIAKNTFLNTRIEDGKYYLERIKTGQTRHYLLQLWRETGTMAAHNRRVANLGWLKKERLENIKVFLEAVFAQYGKHSLDKFSVEIFNERYARDFQELLLYFGVATKLTMLDTRKGGKYRYKFDDTMWLLETLDKPAAMQFWSVFKLPGIKVSIGDIDPPEIVRWEPIIKKTSRNYNLPTYAVHVYTDETYISDYVVVHNSVILEDMLTYQILNSDLEFPKTSEQLLVTPNTNQLTPLLDRIILKFTSSPMLKEFLNNNVNRSKGTLDFKMGSRNHRFYARIAGSRESNNLVGLHIPKIGGDEMQLFPITAFQQLQPTLNTWEPKVQETYYGVPNGLRNSTLYDLDVRRPKYKKYRIPSPNNPYFTLDDWNDSLRKYGGIEEDTFQQLVLGRHGSASFQVIPRDSFVTEPYDFYSYRFTNNDKVKGKKFEDMLKIHKEICKNYDFVIFGIDTGFSDPTIVNVIGFRNNKYYSAARYRFSKIDYPEQEKIIHYLTLAYNPSKIGIDVGAGGGGAAIVQSLTSRPEFASVKYANKLIPVLFNEKVSVGRTDDMELTEVFRSWGSKEIARMVSEGAMVFSELDSEGISQLERLTRQRRTTGNDFYFIMGERGSGASDEDHIYASYLCFIYTLRERIVLVDTTPKLARPSLNSTER